MRDETEIDLEDPEQVEEIRLLADLMVLAAESMGTPDAASVDTVLGLQSDGLPQHRDG